MTDRISGRESARLPAIDFVRGVVMVLMTLDHSSGAFNAGRLMADGAATFHPDMVFEPLQFVIRWVTHLCAPTFVLLSGASLALSVTRRRQGGIESSQIGPRDATRGGVYGPALPRPRRTAGIEEREFQVGTEPAGAGARDAARGGGNGPALPVQRGRESPLSIDRDMLIRGALLIAIDVVWMGWMWRLGLPVQLGVLYAIGVSMIGLIVLRRLPPRVVAALGVAVLAGSEAVTSLLDPTGAIAAATLAGGQVGSIFFLYPFLPWTGFMLVGWAVGMRIVGPGMRIRDWLALAAVAAVTFLVVRGENGYGNFHVLRRDGSWGGSWIEWLHVSKYPPGLAYAGLELAIAFGLLACVWRWARPWKPLVLFGQTALFYYMVHAHLLKGAALVLGVYRREGVVTTLIAWLVTMVVLYPACRWYLGVKRRHPRSVLRFL